MLICESCCEVTDRLYLGLCAECIGPIEEDARAGDVDAQRTLGALEAERVSRVWAEEMGS
jgi:hypothetical protein